MSNGELAYLVMVIASMLIFGVTLAWVSRRPRSQAPHARRQAGSGELTQVSAAPGRNHTPGRLAAGH